MVKEKRLIDAYKLEDFVRSNSARYHHTDDVIAAIAGQPTVDAVEVVRCKDCKHLCNCYDAAERITYGNDFCSCGERISNNANHHCNH